MNKNETETLAYEIADEAARINLESFCVGRLEWLDVKEVDGNEERECVDRAVQYLELRGELRRHLSTPELVQVCRK